MTKIGKHVDSQHHPLFKIHCYDLLVTKLEMLFYPSIKMSCLGPLKSFFGIFERFLLLN